MIAFSWRPYRTDPTPFYRRDRQSNNSLLVRSPWSRNVGGWVTMSSARRRTVTRQHLIQTFLLALRNIGSIALPALIKAASDADLVVLSACESGLGKYITGDGMLGFAQA